MKKEDTFIWVKQLSAYLLMPAALLLHGVAVLRADVPTNPWKSGEQLTATKLNGQLNDLQAQINQLETKPKDTGFVGGIRFDGVGCAFVADLAASATFANVVLSAPSCTATVVSGNVPGVTISAPTNLQGSTLSFKLTGPAGHYVIAASGVFRALNGNTGTAADKVLVVARFFDGMTGSSYMGTAGHGHIAQGVAAGSRYHQFGDLNAGITYASAVNTTVSLQAANVGNTTNTQFIADPGYGPLEIRVYKF